MLTLPLGSRLSACNICVLFAIQLLSRRQRRRRCCRRRNYAIYPSLLHLYTAMQLFAVALADIFNKLPSKKGKGSPYSVTERRVPELIPVLGSQPAGDVSHKPSGRLPLLSARRTAIPANLKRAATSFTAW